MDGHLHNPGLTWQALPPELRTVEPRLRAVLERWRGTRYRSGGDTPGLDADCLGFVFRVIDELVRRPSQWRRNLPADAAMHSRPTALSAMKTLLSYYPAERILGGVVQPADVVIIGPVGGGPGHVQLVGPEPNTVWHCTQSTGVCSTGFGILTGEQQLVATYRLRGRELWA